jgi:hypothetical protein
MRTYLARFRSRKAMIASAHLAANARQGTAPGRLQRPVGTLSRRSAPSSCPLGHQTTGVSHGLE